MEGTDGTEAQLSEQGRQGVGEPTNEFLSEDARDEGLGADPAAPRTEMVVGSPTLEHIRGLWQNITNPQLKDVVARLLRSRAK